MMSYEPGPCIKDAIRASHENWYLKKLAQQRDKRMRVKKAADCSPQKIDKQIDSLIKELGFND